MADYDLTLSHDAIPALLEQPAALGKLVETILNQVLEAQMREHLGADRYERSEERDGYRNEYRERQLSTRVGPLILRVPQTRDGSFSTEVFERYRRSEQAFVLGLMEMVINGVSTRKVTRITEALCGTAFSKSTVSRLTKALDEPVAAFLARRLEAPYPFVIVDALFTKVRTDKRVLSKALLIASGVRADGFREVLGLAIGDAESFVAWDEMFRGLKNRGLRDVDLVVSDDHRGLREAIAKNFVGATWQRCARHAQPAGPQSGEGARKRRSCCKGDLRRLRSRRSATAIRRLSIPIFQLGAEGMYVFGGSVRRHARRSAVTREVSASAPLDQHAGAAQ